MTARSLQNLRDTTAGVYILVRKLNLSPPPSENDIFPPLATCYFFTPIVPPFALILPYFALILPFYTFFSTFFLFSFSFPFLPFCHAFSPFFSSPFHIFSPKWHWLIYPPQGGGGYLPIYRPLCDRPEWTGHNCHLAAHTKARPSPICPSTAGFPACARNGWASCPRSAERSRRRCVFAPRTATGLWVRWMSRRRRRQQQ